MTQALASLSIAVVIGLEVWLVAHFALIDTGRPATAAPAPADEDAALPPLVPVPGERLPPVPAALTAPAPTAPAAEEDLVSRAMGLRPASPPF